MGGRGTNLHTPVLQLWGRSRITLSWVGPSSWNALNDLCKELGTSRRAASILDGCSLIFQWKHDGHVVPSNRAEVGRFRLVLVLLHARPSTSANPHLAPSDYWPNEGHDRIRATTPRSVGFI